MGFLRIAQAVQHVTQGAFAVQHAQGAVGVHGGVVPGGHLFAVHRLGRVPRWRDVRLRPVEDGHGLLRQQGPHAIGPRHMAQQRAVRALVRVEEQGDVVGVQRPLVRNDQRGQRLRAHQRLQGGRVRHLKLAVGVGHVRHLPFARRARSRSAS